MTTPLARKFDHWIRNEFKAINTELEQAYFATECPDQVAETGTLFKQKLLTQGHVYIKQLLAEGNTDEGFESGFDLLGNVGFYMAACRRHEIDESVADNQQAMKDVSALAMQLGACLGVAPRFASAHLETHNRAINGVYKTFTFLEDEKIFIDYNTRSVMAFIRASEALLHIVPLGISHPVTHDLLCAAKNALEDVVRYNEELFELLDVDRFFYNVRPYYKTHKVGRNEYRGANAGDFAGINAIDLLLGVCRADDPYYSQLLVDKFLFMRPDQQLILRDCMRRESLLDQFLALADTHSDTDWYQRNLKIFLEVCESHGNTARQHHQQLVSKFIERPASANNLYDKQDMSSSGPPLAVLVKALKKLHDLRTAADREDIPTRFHDFARLQATLAVS